MSIIDEALKKALSEKEAKIRSEYKEIPHQPIRLESQRVNRRNQGMPRRILFILVPVVDQALISQSRHLTLFPMNRYQPTRW